MAEKHPQMRWTFRQMRDEPSFWSRVALPGEMDGFDPLSGLIIAHSKEEMDRLDAAALAALSPAP